MKKCIVRFPISRYILSNRGFSSFVLCFKNLLKFFFQAQLFQLADCSQLIILAIARTEQTINAFEDTRSFSEAAKFSASQKAVAAAAVAVAAVAVAVAAAAVAAAAVVVAAAAVEAKSRFFVPFHLF